MEQKGLPVLYDRPCKTSHFRYSWESSLDRKGGHFKKQWLMKNSEETKEVPGVDEVVMEELRKRNVDLSTIEGKQNPRTVSFA